MWGFLGNSQQQVRACLVSDRVRLEEAKSASFPRRTASYGPYLRGSFLRFRSVSTEEKLLREVRCVPQNVSRFNLHLYQTGSKLCVCRYGNLLRITGLIIRP